MFCPSALLANVLSSLITPGRSGSCKIRADYIPCGTSLRRWVRICFAHIEAGVSAELIAELP